MQIHCIGQNKKIKKSESYNNLNFKSIPKLKGLSKLYGPF